MNPLRELPFLKQGLANIGLVSDEYVKAIEHGQVLYLPNLSFDLTASEQRFLTPSWLQGREKSIYLRGEQRQVRGTHAQGRDLDELQGMIERFGVQADHLIRTLCPRYGYKLTRGNTSFRPCEAAGRVQSWRHDDTRLHTDAFPSQPLQNRRILRVFSNVHPQDKPRVWRIGEPFADMAKRFMPQVARQLPGKPWLLHTFGITKSLRSDYDHVMLSLHDLQKADADYQENCPQVRFGFPPGSTWICFSDQVLHAVMEGQYLMEQTFFIPISVQADPDLSPQRILERMTGRELLPLAA